MRQKIKPTAKDLIPIEKLNKMSDVDKLIEFMKLIVPECNINGYSGVQITFQDGSAIGYRRLMHEILHWGC